MQKPENRLKPWRIGTRLRALPSEYQHDRVLVVIKKMCVHVLLIKVPSVMEGLRVPQEIVVSILDTFDNNFGIILQNISKTVVGSVLSKIFSIDFVV